MIQLVFTIVLFANLSFSDDSTSTEMTKNYTGEQNANTRDTQILRDKVLLLLDLEAIEVGSITKNPVINRKPMEFELCESFGVEYEAFAVTRRQNNKETYEDIEIIFQPMSKAQFENLKNKIGENRSQVPYSPGKKYSLIDFLPPPYQATHAVEESYRRGLSSNCWGTAYEMKSGSDTFFYSTTFDNTGDVSNNRLFADILNRGDPLGAPEGNSLKLGDLQLFHEPFKKKSEGGEFAHARSFVACEKNGNHLMFEMPSMGVEPRRFILSSKPWTLTGNFPHWYLIDRTNPTFYPRRGSKEYNDHVYSIRYDRRGRAYLAAKRENLDSFISSNFSDNPLKGVAWLMPSGSDQVAKMRLVWEVVKKDFNERNGQLNLEYMTQIFSIKAWLMKNEDFFFGVVQSDPDYSKINDQLRDFGFGGAF